MDRIKKLQEFLAADPNDIFVQHALAMEYIARGDDATARQLFERILQQDESAIGSYYQLGKLLERAGETTLALKCYEKGMEAAQTSGERRAFNELRTAYDDLADG